MPIQSLSAILFMQLIPVQPKACTENNKQYAKYNYNKDDNNIVEHYGRLCIMEF